MIASLVLCHLLFGALLGTRFRVRVLVPVMLVALPAILAATLAAQAGVWTILGAMLAAAVALQFGYLAGAALQEDSSPTLPRILARCAPPLTQVR
ncbi:hypothetical protein [Blastochloris sulfoviridis]|uniref:Uncharacterized protein n=1 Tax=Blastochloris sulfoviridis TaxID=50712 RepID=A0A5M6I606_9HYPH|nr:hypothetical protein [Blastochloris sulfoviridis]KAA5603676.1 hypothetical protein F1193_00875 [Blastochloris sulfoviridis]